MPSAQSVEPTCIADANETRDEKAIASGYNFFIFLYIVLLD